MEEKVREFLEDFKKSLNEQQKELDDQKKKLEMKQESLNKWRNQIIDLEKELYPQIIVEGDVTQVEDEITQLPVVTMKTLEEAREILFGEFALETDLSARTLNALNRSHKVETLEDLYYLNLKNPKYYTGIRNMGEKSSKEIREALMDMEKAIENVKKRRENIHKYNQPLKFLLDAEIANELEKRYNVTNLEELYNEYTRHRSYNSITKELLRRY